MDYVKFDTLTGSGYNNICYEVMKSVWGAGFKPSVDSRGVPVIGTNINLVNDFDAVIDIMFPGIVGRLKDLLNDEVVKAYSDGQTGLLRKNLDAVLADWAANDDPTIRKTFDFSSEAQVKQLLLLSDGFHNAEILVEAQFGSDLPDSREKAVLVSLAQEAPELLDMDIVADLQAGDRAVAWFDLRYEMNSDGTDDVLTTAQMNAVVHRRYIQADYFGLYNDEKHVGYPEALHVALSYGSSRLAVLGYEKAYGVAPNSAGGDIVDQLQPTIAAVTKHFHVPNIGLEEVLFIVGSSPNISGDGTAFDSSRNDEDLIVGNSASNRILAGQGGDLVLGLAGNDRIDGGAGNDYLYGGAGADNLSGGDGNDQLRGGAGNDRLDGDDDNDRVYGDAGGDVARGGAGNDLVDGGDGTDTVFGGSGLDRLWGGSGSDRLYGESGDDAVYGDAGSDRLYGGTGSDLLNGGSGNDRVYGQAGNDILSGNSGNDILSGDDGRDRLSGGSGNDLLEGGSDSDRLYGGNDRDRLYGQSGNDLLYGGSGNDILNGGKGADRLYGNGGDDALTGDLRYDILAGGSGSDTYRIVAETSDPRRASALPKFTSADIVEARNDGYDTVVVGLSGNYDIHNIERFKLADGFSGPIAVELNEFSSFVLSGKSDDLDITINRLQREAIKITTGGGADHIAISMSPGIDPSQVINHVGLTARFDFTDLTAADTIDLKSFDIKKIVTKDADITSDTGYYLLAPGIKLHLVDGGEDVKVYNNSTDSWFMVKCGDGTPYGPEFVGHITKSNFDI